MSWKRVIYVLLLVLVASFSAVPGGVVGGVVVYQAIRQSKTDISTTSSQAVDVIPASVNTTNQVLTINTSEIETNITQAVQKTGPAVVTVVGTISGQDTFWGPTGDQTVSGSGVFISQEGYVLTNNHVVKGTNLSGYPLASHYSQHRCQVSPAS